MTSKLLKSGEDTAGNAVPETCQRSRLGSLPVLEAGTAEEVVIWEVARALIEGRSRKDIQNMLVEAGIERSKCNSYFTKGLRELRRLNPKKMDEYRTVFFSRFEELYLRAQQNYDDMLAFRILESMGKFFGLEKPQTIKHTGTVTVTMDMGLLGERTDEDVEEE